jgi:hypothetical protein
MVGGLEAGHDLEAEMRSARFDGLDSFPIWFRAGRQ